MRQQYQYPRQSQPKPIVRFRVNGGGIHVFTDYCGWVRADSAIMTNVANILFDMVKYNEKF